MPTLLLCKMVKMLKQRCVTINTSISLKCVTVQNKGNAVKISVREPTEKISYMLYYMIY